MSKKKINRILDCLGVIVLQQVRQGILLENILMNTNELTTIENLNAQLAKVKGEYADFIVEVADKDVLDAATIAALNAQIEVLRAQIGELADPAAAQAALDTAASLVAAMDANRVDIPATPAPEPVPAP